MKLNRDWLGHSTTRRRSRTNTTPTPLATKDGAGHITQFEKFNQASGYLHTLRRRHLGEASTGGPAEVPSRMCLYSPSPTVKRTAKRHIHRPLTFSPAPPPWNRRCASCSEIGDQRRRVRPVDTGFTRHTHDESPARVACNHPHNRTTGGDLQARMRRVGIGMGSSTTSS